MRPPPFAIWMAAICALLAPAFARAQAPQAAQGPPIIRSVDVQYTGPQTVSKDRILAQMRTRVGQEGCVIAVGQVVGPAHEEGGRLVYVGPGGLGGLAVLVGGGPKRLGQQ